MKALTGLLLVFAFCRGTAQVWPLPEEWPMFAGDASASSYTRVAPLGVTNQLWRTNLSVIRTEMITWRHAVAAHGRIYLKSKDTIAALDAVTGQILWNRPLVADQIAATGKGMLLATIANGLIALEGRTGERLWDVTLEESSLSPRLVAGHDFAMLIGGSQAEPVVRFLDAKSGEVLTWDSGLRIRVTGQWLLFHHPSAVPASGTSVVCFGNRDPKVVNLPLGGSRQPGALVCERNLAIAGWADTLRAATPAGEDLVTQCWLVREEDEPIVRWTRTGASPDQWGKADFLCVASSSFAVMYSSATGQLVAFNPNTGSEHWKSKKGWPLVAMVAGGQHVYAAFQMPPKSGGVSPGTQLQVIDLGSGETLVRHDLPAFALASMVPAYRKLYLLGHHNPAAAKPGVAPAAIPVMLCLGNP